MTAERLREILFFFRANALYLLLAVLPFTALAALAVQLFGEPIVPGRTLAESRVNWRSAGLLAALYPLALGLTTLVIHLRAGNEPMPIGQLVTRALRLWPGLMLICLQIALLLVSALFLALALGRELLLALGLLQSPLAILLFFCLLPALWVYARLGTATVIAVTEEALPITALVESWRRTAPDQQAIMATLMMLFSGIFLVLLLVVTLLRAIAPGTVESATFLEHVLADWLFCLVPVAFYRYWSLRAPAS